MLISVVIPTRERGSLLGPSLETVLADSDPNLEVVVSDNHSRDETPELLRRQTDPRLRVVRPECPVSMRRNFETALSAAAGDYVIFLGDDDGVMPGGIAMLRSVLTRQPAEAVSWEMLHYTWPSARANQQAGFVRIKPKSVYGGVSRRAPAALLSQAVSGRLRNYKETANIYHGCVSRRLIERVRNANNGVYFGGAIPDVYACMANLAQMRDDLLWIDHPVTCGGASDRSNGAAQVAAVRAAPSGAEESARFVAEAADDPGVAQIDISIPSVDALTLDMLELVNRTHARGRLDLDYHTWMDRIVARLARLPRERFETGMAILDAYAAEGSRKAALDAAKSRHPFAGPEEPPEGGRPSRSRIAPLRMTLADPVQLATIRQATEALGTVLGSGHRPDRARGAPGRWIAWAGALRRAAIMVRSWG